MGPKKNQIEADSDLAARTVDELHKRAFSGKFGLTPDELKLFDGTQSLAQRAQRDAVKKAVE